MAVGIGIDFNSRRVDRYFARLKRQFPAETKREIGKAADDAVKEVKRLVDNNVLQRRTSRYFNSVRKRETGRRSAYNFHVFTDAMERGRSYPRFLESGFIHYQSGNRVGPFEVWGRTWRWAEARLDKRLRRLMRRLL